MDRSSVTDRPLRRRTVLGGLAGLAAGVGVGVPRVGGTDAEALSVLTWNVYLGVELGGLSEVSSIDEFRRTAGDLMESAEEHPYEERAEAIAAEIDAAGPDVVALQETARLRKRDTDADEWTEIADLLELIESALADRDAGYERAVSAVSTDVELTGETDDGEYDVGLTDRDAILVREGLDVGETDRGTYDARLTYPMPVPPFIISLERAYCTATVETGSGDVTVACTHLESHKKSTRRRQAQEFLDVVPSEGPVVAAGDFNSGPGTTTEAYDLLTESFTDAYAQARSDAEGYTCCQPSSLTNGQSRLGKRVDEVLHRGGTTATAAERIADDPDDRFELERDGETVEMWPSDHAGVLATVDVPQTTTTATATASASTAEPTTAEPTAEPTTLQGTTSQTPTPTNTEPATPTESTASPTADPSTPSPTATTTANGTGTVTAQDRATTAGETEPPSTTAGNADAGGPATDESGPGFGVLSAVAGLSGAALARWRSD